MQTLIAIGFLIDWTIRIGALFVVPQNRKPSSATAWLMLILLLPFIGLIIFIIFGSPKLNKQRRAMQKSMDKSIAEALYSNSSKHLYADFIAKDYPAKLYSFISLSKNLGGFPAFKGNGIELLEDYDKTIKSIANDIKHAKQFVHIEYYILAMDYTTECLFVEIEHAVKRGVKVRILFDAIGSRKYPLYKEMQERLTTIGVDWHTMLPLKLPGKNFNRPDLRNHRKIVVIDGVIGYTGSQNLITRNYHRKDELYYEELVARLQGPIVMQLHATFITDWCSETNELLTRNTHPELLVDLRKNGSALAQVLPSGPGFDNDNNLKLFTSLIHAANKKITIVNPYFVPDDSLITAITSAAQRGVDVVMINSQIIDQPLVGYAQRSYFDELLSAGVKLYQYDIPILLHSKYMIIDNEIAVIGSSNLDMRSFQLDLEITLVTYDDVVAVDLERVTKNYLKRAHILHLEDWRKRPIRLKLYENIARLTSAVQ